MTKSRLIFLLLLPTVFLGGAVAWNFQSTDRLSNVKFVLQEIEFSDGQQSDLVEVYLQQNDRGETQKRPVIIIGKILNSADRVAKASAKMFIEAGFHAVVVQNPNFIHIFNSIHQVSQMQVLGEAFLRQNLFNEAVLNWVKNQTQWFDTQNIGLFGISFGAIMMTYLLAKHHSDIRAAFFALPGSNFKDLFLNSLEPSIRNCRKRLIQSQQTSYEQSVNTIANIIDAFKDVPDLHRIHPIQTQLIKDKVYLLNALFDTVVPRKNADITWNLLGQPQRTIVPLSHYSSILYFWGIKQKSLVWFQNKFS